MFNAGQQSDHLLNNSNLPPPTAMKPNLHSLLSTAAAAVLVPALLLSAFVLGPMAGLTMASFGMLFVYVLAEMAVLSFRGRHSSLLDRRAARRAERRAPALVALPTLRLQSVNHGRDSNGRLAA